MSPTTRQNLEKIHKWAGLVVWPFLLFQAITGALIVDNEATSQFFDSQMFVSELRAGEADSAAALRALPRLDAGETYGAVIFPIREDFPVLAIKVPATPAIPTMIAVDPANGRITGQKPVLAVPMVVANLWHESLFAGPVGKGLLILIAAAFVVLIVTGVLRWWPKGSLLRAVRIRWAGSLARSLWQAHAPIGAIFAAILLWLAVTGGLTVVNAMRMAEAKPGDASALPASAAEIEHVIIMARSQLPGSRLVAIQPASKLTANHIAVFVDTSWRQERVVLARSGKVLEIDHADSLLDWMLPLHRGSMMPNWVRALWYLFAAGLIALSVSGFVINRAKRKLRQKRG